MNENPVIEMTGAAVSAMRDADFVALEDVNWSVAAGEFWVVAGQPYSGKSDFLMTTAGLLPLAHGRCKFFGDETFIFDESRLADRLRVGFVFESTPLFHYLTVAENITLPLRYHKNLPAGQALKLVEDLLALTELQPIADVTPTNLPRGWHKRAGLARALALRPEILLLDNPLHGLDARHAHWWLRFLDALARGHPWCGGKPTTIIATTDDLRPWRGGARRFALLKEKKFIPLGSWDEVIASRDAVVNELLAAPLEMSGEPTEDRATTKI